MNQRSSLLSGGEARQRYQQFKQVCYTNQSGVKQDKVYLHLIWDVLTEKSNHIYWSSEI